LKYFVYCTERAIACAKSARRPTAEISGVDADPGRVAVVVDFQGYSVLTRPGLGTVLKALGLFRRFYADRLGVAVLVDPPRRVAAALRPMMRALLGAEVARRFVVVSGTPEERATALRELIDPSVLEASVGGHNTQQFDAQVFLRQPVGGDVFGSELDGQLKAKLLSEGDSSAAIPKSGFIASLPQVLRRLLRPCPSRYSSAAASTATC